MRLLSLLILISSLFSCATATKEVREVFVKCPAPEIPPTPKPKIQKEATYPEKLKSLLDYMFALEKENELLRDALDMCRK